MLSSNKHEMLIIKELSCFDTLICCIYLAYILVFDKGQHLLQDKFDVISVELEKRFYNLKARLSEEYRLFEF